MEVLELQKKIRRLLKEKNAILLSHNYQRDEIQEIADLAGDSLELSIKASQSDYEIIVFCGVHFMAESASILSPEKKVILPRLDAGCPMADMISEDIVIDKKRELLEATVVTYVNSSASVKARSDICCTSANAISVVNSVKSEAVYMFPDKNLAKYVSRFTDKKVLLWEGYCPTHNRLKAKEVLESKTKHPNAIFIAHPECKPEVLELADHICSTSGMYEYAKKTNNEEFIIGTEMGILYRLRKENPKKSFFLASKSLVCPNMKLITLESVLSAIIELSNVVKVPEEIRIPSKKALDRMLAVPRDST
ncbi:MAG: quinolinate synthase NadA [Thermodesulfobacteriota bacterium]|nr:quinolinate synthase NadA [Thermodesulfobacteriota bacterium]